MNRAAALLLLGLLSACGGSDPAEQTADRLEEAAEQSDPAAAQVLENAADEVRDGDGAASGAAAQQALGQAGNAQAATVPAPQPVPPQQGAKPHAPGDPVPPPKVKASEQ
jgi:hypothetical protein